MDVVHVTSDNGLGDLGIDVFQEQIAADGAFDGLLQDVSRGDVAARSPLDDGLCKMKN